MNLNLTIFDVSTYKDLAKVFPEENTLCLNLTSIDPRVTRDISIHYPGLKTLKLCYKKSLLYIKEKKHMVKFAKYISSMKNLICLHIEIPLTHQALTYIYSMSNLECLALYKIKISNKMLLKQMHNLYILKLLYCQIDQSVLKYLCKKKLYELDISKSRVPYSIAKRFKNACIKNLYIMCHNRARICNGASNNFKGYIKSIFYILKKNLSKKKLAHIIIDYLT